VNYRRNAIVPNLAIVPVGRCSNCGAASDLPSIAIYSSQDTHVLVDIVGFFATRALTGGLLYSSLAPTRIVDSRLGQGVGGSSARMRRRPRRRRHRCWCRTRRR
jgi:hypothetical protein